ncbi:unnamed protein product [Caenorhabditis nigoni]
MTNAGTSQGNDWRYIPPLNINTVIQNPVSSIKFDPYEELFWTGSATGKVASWLPTNHFSRYTAFAISRHSGVHHIEPTENAIFTLTSTNLRATSRQGVPLGTYTPKTMQNMVSLHRLPGSSTFVLGGFDNKLIIYDFAKEKEIRTTDLESDETGIIIRYNGTNTFTADSLGRIHVKNPKNFETVRIITCHSDKVLDFDVQGHHLVTCGLSLQSKHSEKFIKVYDLRMYKHVSPISMNHCPQFVRFMPSYCDRLAVVYQTCFNRDQIDVQPNAWTNYPAGVRMLDMMSPVTSSIEFSMDTAIITSFDYSSTKNFLAVGNSMGMVNLFTDRDQPLVNENSKDTIFALPPVQPPVSFVIDDVSHSVGSIPIPFPQEDLVSNWPSELTQIVHRPRKPPSEMKNAKSIHYALQITNPRIHTNLKLFNIVPYFLDHEFIEIPSDQKVMESPIPVSIEKVKVSKLYKKRAPPVIQGANRRRKTTDDTVECYKWNVIRHVTMQSTHAMNLVANAVVQVVYYMTSLRNIVLQHICLNDSCITCELHFLFTAFPSKIGLEEGIVTMNLAWALARNGVSLKTGGVLSAIQQVTRTILDDMTVKDSDDSTVVTKFDRHLRCVRCQKVQNVEQGTVSFLTLNYASIQQASFCQLVEKSLHLGPDSGERQCEDCKEKTRMECKRKIRELSPVLLIDTNTSSVDYLEFWQRQLAADESRPVSFGEFGRVPESPLEKKQCRYGEACRDQRSCKYGHGLIDWAAEQTKLLDDIDGFGWKHYLPSRISAKVCDGIVRLSDISDVPNYEEPGAVIYELDAMISLIGNGQQDVVWTHPVTLLRESPVASTAWTLINEQLVSRLHDHEARHLDARWKLPAFIGYRQKGYEVAITERNVSDELFFAENNVALCPNDSAAVKAIDELPKKGDLVGLDAEFIRIKTNLLEFNGKSVQTKALGRASCLDVTGEKIIFDDHIKLDEDVEVVDYLTKFSGIVESDLSPQTSDKYLTTHKRLMLRMHVLIQRGVVFVGHAVHNDFAVINVHIAEPQIIDTVNLWRLGAQRMLSLQFLVREVLGESIQEFSHDSVVDARYTLKLYHKYLEMKENGIFGPEMRRMYAIMPPLACSPNPSGSPLTINTLRLPQDETAGPAPNSV